MGRKVNCLSYDGACYSLEFKAIEEPLEPEKLNPNTTGILRGMNKLVVFQKVDDKTPNLVPIVRLDREKLRCPYCWEGKCLREGKMPLHNVGVPYPHVLTYIPQDNSEARHVAKRLYYCTSKKHQPMTKLFIMERNYDAVPAESLRTMHCMACNAGSESLSITFEFAGKKMSNTTKATKLSPSKSFELDITIKCSRCGMKGGTIRTSHVYREPATCQNRKCGSSDVKRKLATHIVCNSAKLDVAVYECEICQSLSLMHGHNLCPANLAIS